MPMPKFTKPYDRNFIQTDEPDMRTALASISREGTKLLRTTRDSMTVWFSPDGAIVARRYQYQHSAQCMVSVRYREHVPQGFAGQSAGTHGESLYA